MEKLRNALNKVLNLLAGLSMTVMVVLTTYQVPVVIDQFKPPVRKAFHIFAEVIAFLFSATILVFGGYQVSQLAMGQQTSSLGVAVGVFYWVMPVCGVIILIYSVLNIIGIANGSISLDTPEDADFAKVEAEMAAAAEKENKED